MRTKPHLNTEAKNDLDRVFDGEWDSFEAWVRQVIGGDFTWKIHSRDTPELRQLITDSIRASMADNDGVFPDANDLLARVKVA
jgi:hypothetical protein